MPKQFIGHSADKKLTLTLVVKRSNSPPGTVILTLTKTVPGQKPEQLLPNARIPETLKAITHTVNAAVSSLGRPIGQARDNLLDHLKRTFVP